MICLQENVCFLHSILLQGLCVSPPVNTCVRERWSAPCRLCFTGRVDEAQAFINHKLFTHFLPHCQVSCLNLIPRVFHFLLLFFFLLFFPPWEVVQSKSKPGLFTEVATLHK